MDYKLIKPLDSGMSLVEVAGEIKYLAHGIFGERASSIIGDIAEGEVLSEDDLTEISVSGGNAVSRLFNTEAEVVAYWNGVYDMAGHHGYATTEFEVHVQLNTTKQAS